MSDPKDIYFTYSVSIETGVSLDGDDEMDIDDDIVEEIVDKIREELIKTKGRREIYLSGEIVVPKDWR
jgi:hypothetical protein